MSNGSDPDRWARLRFAIIGPLLAAPPARGELRVTLELMQTLCDHALGNYRVLTTMAAELLTLACQQELTQLDEKLYLEAFATAPSRSRKSA